LTYFMKKLSRRTKPAALALAVSALFASLAQAQTLKDVVVTPTRNAQPLADALPHTTVLGPEEITRSQAIDLPSLLSREAGFQFNQNGGRGTSSSLFLRGSASLQVLVLVDGVAINKQDATGSVSLEHLMLDQIERVEIVRGNVSAIYGTGAIGGVIQVFTKKGGGQPSAQFTVEVGSRSSNKVSASTQGAFGAEGATKISAGVAANRTNGFTALNPTQAAAANPDADGYRNDNWSFSLSQDLAKGHTVGLRNTHSKGRFDFDSNFDAPTDIHKGQTAIDATTLFTENRFTRDWLSKFSWSESRDRNSNDFPANVSFGTAAFTDHYVTKNRVLNWTNTIALADTISLTGGLESQRQSIDADDGLGRQYQVKRQTRAVFGGVQGQFGAHSLQANVRHDSLSNIASETTGYLGYGFDIGKEWKALASVSSAFNVPPLGYLYAPFIGNPALQPEKARSHELGLQYSSGDHIVRGTYFSTRVRDQLVYDNATSIFQNVARTKNSGLELSYSGKVGATDVRASLTQQDPVDESTGQQLPRRAKSLAALSLSQPLGAWRLGADLRYSGGRPDGANYLSAYTVMDLSARYQITPELEAFGRVENVSDKVYQTAYGYNQTPRGVFVGVRWAPKF
jgi:vitamin B12 transporter